MESPELSEFFSVLRNGDPEQVAALMSELEPFLASVIRRHRVAGRLPHTFQTVDIAQSLIKDFLARTSELPPLDQTQGGAEAFLAAAVKNKVVSKQRRARLDTAYRAERGQVARLKPTADALQAEHELEDALHEHLCVRDRLLLKWKKQQYAWTEIGKRLGQKPDAVRMRLQRHVAVILARLGVELPNA